MHVSQIEKKDKLPSMLILDDLFDLEFYVSLRKFAKGDMRNVLDRLIPVETRHFNFWQEFFGIQVSQLNLSRRIKLKIFLLFSRIFGAGAMHLILEAIEIYGVRKYLRVWSIYKDDPLGKAVRSVLEDEFKHEEDIVSGNAELKIQPARIRDIFLGLNDGLVEILGAVSGFFAAFQTATSVLIAGFTVAVAGGTLKALGGVVALAC